METFYYYNNVLLSAVLVKLAAVVGGHLSYQMENKPEELIQLFPQRQMNESHRREQSAVRQKVTPGLWLSMNKYNHDLSSDFMQAA